MRRVDGTCGSCGRLAYWLTIFKSGGLVCATAKTAMLGKRREVGHEAVFDFCSGCAAARRVLAAAGDHLYVRLLDRHQLGGGRKAVRGVRQDASVQLSVRHPADADAGCDG